MGILGDLSTGLASIGGAVSDLYGSSGSAAAASSYAQAADIATQNVGLAEQATKIQETQESRQIYQTIGKQQAAVGGAGMAESGSALDLLRSSASQGALTKAMTAEQGAITANAYSEQAGLYMGLSRAAGETSSAQNLGGILQGAAGAIQIGSVANTLLGNPIGTAISGAGAASAAGSIVGPATGSIVGSTDVATVSAVTDTGAGIVATDLGTSAAADAGAAAAADTAAGSSILDTIVAVAGWVVCTELNKQGRLPTRWYAAGARRFGQYDEASKRGYYLWAIPAVRHLRTRPDSLLSRSLEWVFNHRAEYIAAQAGVRGARKTFAGWATLAGVFAVCWTLGRTVARSPLDWSVLYLQEAK